MCHPVWCVVVLTVSVVCVQYCVLTCCIREGWFTDPRQQHSQDPRPVGKCDARRELQNKVVRATSVVAHSPPPSTTEAGGAQKAASLSLESNELTTVRKERRHNVLLVQSCVPDLFIPNSTLKDGIALLLLFIRTRAIWSAARNAQSVQCTHRLWSIHRSASASGATRESYRVRSSMCQTAGCDVPQTLTHPANKINVSPVLD